MCEKCGGTTRNVTGYVTTAKKEQTVVICSKCGYRKVIK